MSQYTSFDIRAMVTGALPYPEFLKEKILNTQISLDEIGESEVMDSHGMPYFMDLYVYLPKGNSTEKVRFPFEPLVSWGLQKNIVETPVVSTTRKGPVLEYISTDRYAINIRGACIDPTQPNRYPVEQVDLIKRIVDVNAAIEVENPLLNRHDIHKIVIRNCGWDEMEGVPGAQRYFIRAVSDEDFLAERKNRLP